MPRHVRAIAAHHKRSGITLMELLTVVIIIGILAGIALPAFTRQQEDSRDKEAIANLKYIQDAERTYSFEVTPSGAAPVYYPAAGSVTGAAPINTNLKLSLVDTATPAWIYTVWSNGCGEALRNGDDGRRWYLRITDNGSAVADCNFDGEPNKNTCYTCP